MTSRPPGAAQTKSDGRRKTVVLVSLVVALAVAVTLLIALVVSTRSDTDASLSNSVATQTSTIVVPAPTDAAPTTGSSDGLFGKNRLDSGLCEDNGRCRLSSPSSNFYCVITAEQASCFAPQGEALVDGVTVPLSGEPGKQVAANGIGVDSTGETSIFAVTAGVSKLLTRQEMAPFRFPYDNQLEVLGYTCAVGEQTGVSCKNDQTGHGLSVTKQRYFFF